MKLVLLTIFLVAAVFAEPESDPKAITKADSDALIYYNTYGYWPTGYTGYYYTYPSYVWGRKKRSAEAESEPEPNPKAITKADSDALIYYNTYGYWPAAYTGYYYTHGLYGLYGRKKRSPESEPAPESSAITKADSDAWYYYTTYGHWPAGYTGYYYTHPYVLYGRKKRSPESEPEATPEGKADPYYVSTYYTYPAYYTYSYYPYVWYGK